MEGRPCGIPHGRLEYRRLFLQYQLGVDEPDDDAGDDGYSADDEGGFDGNVLCA